MNHSVNLSAFNAEQQEQLKEAIIQFSKVDGVTLGAIYGSVNDIDGWRPEVDKKLDDIQKTLNTLVQKTSKN